MLFRPGQEVPFLGCSVHRLQGAVTLARLGAFFSQTTPSLFPAPWSLCRPALPLLGQITAWFISAFSIKKYGLIEQLLHIWHCTRDF